MLAKRGYWCNEGLSGMAGVLLTNEVPGVGQTLKNTKKKVPFGEHNNILQAFPYMTSAPK